ncbi:flavin-containing monooxygenase [Gracilibacillus thailandensis]|uniref:SidA/IucD/PvdA family monooxygenase n=1 Tax=Gracilibacillus thailandensis TaxID=563735 RepID=A0A6N7QXW1_9BACI|nr:NAD(P)-binding domain-containing protein [Gracilibacillus thailandensis]MRI65721.1 SidA/IucD/PvdA family monooxygenase [Gracilibacillus thailandensis]
MYNTIVIGAGQVGLAIGYYLKQFNHSFLILDKSQEAGEVWDKRYDSLVLFTPRAYSALPGLDLKGDPQDFPTKDEISQYLKVYAESFNLPIKYKTNVTDVQRKNNIYYISTESTEHMEYKAENIIIATGPFQKPKIPDLANKLSKDIVQLHSSEYQNPSQLKEGKVLVVGGGNSGAQIALELSQEMKTFLSTSQHLTFLPMKIRNKSIFWWFDKFGVLKATSNSLFGKLIQKRGDPIFGLELKYAIRNGDVAIKERTIGGKENKVIFQDNTFLDVDNIIWATGFKPDYSWLNVSGVLDGKGKPIHNRGITNMEGLYFLGLPWLYRRGSALLQGVGYDAKYLVKHIQNNNER